MAGNLKWGPPANWRPYLAEPAARHGDGPAARWEAARKLKQEGSHDEKLPGSSNKQALTSENTSTLSESGVRTDKRNSWGSNLDTWLHNLSVMLLVQWNEQAHLVRVVGTENYVLFIL